MVQHLGQFAAAHVVHAPRDVVPGGGIPDGATIAGPPILERVGLENQVMMAMRRAGKFGHDLVDEGTVRPEWRMALQARIMFQLQRHQQIGTTGKTEAPPLDRLRQPVLGRQDQPEKVEPEFLEHGKRAVADKTRIAPMPGDDQVVIEGAVEPVLAHVAPSRGRAGDFRGRVADPQPHLGQGYGAKGGMSVRSPPLVADPVGAQIALLEHVKPQARPRRGCPCFGMDRAHIAINHDVGDPAGRDDLRQMAGPVRRAAQVTQKMGLVRPEEFVTRIEGAAPDLRPRVAQ